jgi:TubC N-terminal docking domain
VTAPPARAVLASLRRQGVAIEAERERLHVDAPAGMITAEIRQALAQLKPDLLGLLVEEQRLLDCSLDEFAGGDRAIEIRVPWFDETLWFVPRVEHAEVLVREGVARGRVWTAGELIDLASVDGVTPADIERIGRLKATFGAQIVSVSPDDQVAL